jgi:hypothetical protein
MAHNFKQLLEKARITEPRKVLVEGVNFGSNMVMLRIEPSSKGNVSTKEIGKFTGFNYKDSLNSQRTPYSVYPLVDPMRKGKVMGCWVRMAEDAGLTDDEIEYLKTRLPIWTSTVERDANGDFIKQYNTLHAFNLHNRISYDLTVPEQAIEYHVLKYALPSDEETAFNANYLYYLTNDEVIEQENTKRFDVFKDLNALFQQKGSGGKYRAAIVYLYTSEDPSENVTSILDLSLENVNMLFNSILFGGNQSNAKRMLNVLNMPDILYRNQAVMAITLGVVMRDPIHESYKYKDGSLLGVTFEDFVVACSTTHKDEITKRCNMMLNGLEQNTFERSKLTAEDMLAYIQGFEEPQKKHAKTK